MFFFSGNQPTNTFPVFHCAFFVWGVFQCLTCAHLLWCLCITQHLFLGNSADASMKGWTGHRRDVRIRADSVLWPVAGQNYTSGQARVTTCVSFSFWTVDTFSYYVIKGWVRALVENIKNPHRIKCTRKASPGNLEGFVFCLSKNVSLRPLHKHSVPANWKLLVITISVISMSFPPAHTLFSDSLSRLRLISHQEACLERLQVSGCHDNGMNFSWEWWSLSSDQLQGSDKVKPVPVLVHPIFCLFW